MIRFTRPFQRFLALLEAGDRTPLQMSNELKGTVSVGDYSDVGPPHSNPIFGSQGSQAAAGGGTNAKIVISSALRPIRIHVLNVSVGTTVRIGVLAANPLTTVVATATPFPLGPQAGDTATTLQTVGHSAAITIPGPALIPTSEYLDLLGGRGLLIAPGMFFVIENNTTDDTVTAGTIIEELPRFGEVTNIGYPGIDD